MVQFNARDTARIVHNRRILLSSTVHIHVRPSQAVTFDIGSKSHW